MEGMIFSTENRPGKFKCKTKQAACNIGGVGICNPASFRSGDYSCLYKESGYYTRACVGAGQFGFWQIPEVY